MGKISFLKCRECGRKEEPVKVAVCSDCFAPVDVTYDTDSINLTREELSRRPRTIWRYMELLPVSDERFVVDLGVGFTPLSKCPRLGETLGINKLYVKNDSVNPTYSFKDRPAAVAVSKAREFGDEAVGCASTGNLAGAVAAHAGKANLLCYVLAPYNIEPSKIAQIAAYGARIIGVKGTYDDANRLAVLASEEFGWNIVNVTSRPYYVEGSKTMAFEICEQLGWELPDHIIIPVASGALLCAISRGFEEFAQLDLIKSADVVIHGAQAMGCGPVAEAFERNSNEIIPVEKPQTIASSIAIGDPGDGIYVLKNVRERGGTVGGVSDNEIVEAIKALARTEGIFSEPAGGVTIALLKRLVEDGTIKRDESVVCCVTGNGLKTGESVMGRETFWVTLEPNLEALRKVVGG